MPQGLSRNVRAALAAVIVLSLAGCAAWALSIPPDARLGKMVRFVMFHGASTWVNMATFALAGLFGIAQLLGFARARAWGEAFRWFSLPLWAFNAVLGIVSMKLLWGGILWEEPRLLMTFGVLAGSVIVLAMQLIFDDPRVPAVLDALLGGALWYLVAALPNLFHPESPVFSSGDPAYIHGFFGMVATLAIAALSLVTLIAQRRRQESGEAAAGLCAATETP